MGSFDPVEDFYLRLPQQGPGSEECTLHAWRTATRSLTPDRILDVGCGGGRQTLAIARASNARIDAVDLHTQLVTQRVAEAGLGDRVSTHTASMDELPFEDESFDGIWSEGAIYNIGFAEGLGSWRRLLRPDGFLAVTHLCWTTNDRPDEAAAFWREAYPPMTGVDVHLGEVEAAGYEVLEHFPLGRAAWWDDFYGPMEALIAELRAEHAGDAEVLGFLDENQAEIEISRRFGDTYDYVFFVCSRRP